MELEPGTGAALALAQPESFVPGEVKPEEEVEEEGLGEVWEWETTVIKQEEEQEAELAESSLQGAGVQEGDPWGTEGQLFPNGAAGSGCEAGAALLTGSRKRKAAWTAKLPQEEGGREGNGYPFYPEMGGEIREMREIGAMGEIEEMRVMGEMGEMGGPLFAVPGDEGCQQFQHPVPREEVPQGSSSGSGSEGPCGSSLISQQQHQRQQRGGGGGQVWASPPPPYPSTDSSPPCSRASRHFSELEKRVLLGLIERHRSVLESRKGDAGTVLRKQRTWQQLGAEFNGHPCVFHRDAKQLRKCWENIKARAKKTARSSAQARRAKAGAWGGEETGTKGKQESREPGPRGKGEPGEGKGSRVSGSEQVPGAQTWRSGQESVEGGGGGRGLGLGLGLGLGQERDWGLRTPGWSGAGGQRRSRLGVRLGLKGGEPLGDGPESTDTPKPQRSVNGAPPLSVSASVSTQEPSLANQHQRGFGEEVVDLCVEEWGVSELKKRTPRPCSLAPSSSSSSSSPLALPTARPGETGSSSRRETGNQPLPPPPHLFTSPALDTRRPEGARGKRKGLGRGLGPPGVGPPRREDQLQLSLVRLQIRQAVELHMVKKQQLRRAGELVEEEHRARMRVLRNKEQYWERKLQPLLPPPPAPPSYPALPSQPLLSSPPLPPPSFPYASLSSQPGAGRLGRL
ncbi:myb/SANT-like DNA-binding domain-containing protein 3 [Polyodon spathula]|uniref:myb/SANT-like DNA-binding domain-containing protein 3 n=1 Tax=Polyodon spathula TaxID=7913 RepID=UPI001B7E30D5|nr:myb/SANT-like DNA-binding domain-containing protein 3 [Polyodon spathula]